MTNDNCEAFHTKLEGLFGLNGPLCLHTSIIKVKAPWKKRNGGEVLERLERRLHEELLRLFNESGSFYFMLRGDLTNSMQRQYSGWLILYYFHIKLDADLSNNKVY